MSGYSGFVASMLALILAVAMFAWVAIDWVSAAHKRLDALEARIERLEGGR